MKIIQLGLLLALLKLSSTNVAADDSDDIWHVTGSEAPSPCRARAWVRAPDLEPGLVVQGDVKVKLDGDCGQVQSYTLRLRFAERSWVKTKRHSVQLPKPPNPRAYFMDPLPENGTIVIPGDCDMNGCSGFQRTDYSSWNEYQNIVQDPSLWLVREEERFGFEAKYSLSDGKQITYDVVEPFAILVPSTLYPPAFNPTYKHLLLVSLDGKLDITGSEHVYMYTIEVAFMNRTILEVPAGYTSFNYYATVNVTVSRPLPHIKENSFIPEIAEPEVVDDFILEVTFPHGRHLEPGSVNNITIVSHRTGPGIEHANSVWCRPVVEPKRHWAASLAADNETAEHLLGMGLAYSSQLKPTNPSMNNVRVVSHDPYQNDVTRPNFLQDGAVSNGTTFSTKPVVAQFDVWENFYPNFQMYYQAIEAELSITLGLMRPEISPLVSNEDTDTLDPEEYDWIPTVKRKQSRRNNPPSRILSARIPLFIHTKQDDPIKSITTETVHYLSPEARAPVFVDPMSVKDLLQKSMNERDALSPKAQPNFITREGSVVEERYFAHEQPGMHYVGDTWLRKVVLPRKENEAETQVGGLRIQS